jgi:hypothetical protein
MVKVRKVARIQLQRDQLQQHKDAEHFFDEHFVAWCPRLRYYGSAKNTCKVKKKSSDFGVRGRQERAI